MISSVCSLAHRSCLTTWCYIIMYPLSICYTCKCIISSFLSELRLQNWTPGELASTACGYIHWPWASCVCVCQPCYDVTIYSACPQGNLWGWPHPLMVNLHFLFLSFSLMKKIDPLDSRTNFVCSNYSLNPLTQNIVWEQAHHRGRPFLSLNINRWPSCKQLKSVIYVPSNIAGRAGRAVPGLEIM